MADEPIGCARPTGTQVGKPVQEDILVTEKKESKMTTAKVGAKAPEFQAPAYYRGAFTTVKLSDFFGKWLILCFYPGDFTFV